MPMNQIFPVPPACSANRGFTLTEMAIVLVLVSILIVGMAIPLNTQIEYRNISETEKILEEIREALIGFSVVNRRLPRPAISIANGTERVQCANDTECTGLIPWDTLGVRKLDAWGKVIRYSVTPAFSGGTTVGTNIPIALTTGPTKNIRTRSSSAGPDMALATGLPAVVFSHGQRNLGQDTTGNAFPDSDVNNADEDANNAGPTVFYWRLHSRDPAAPGGEFDDIVVWISPNVLFNRMISAGRLP